MGINTVLALLTTRFALKALGVADFGLFSVLGSIISFMGVFNTIMLSTSNRFIAVAIGKGDEELINRTFNINVLIFISCAILLLIIGCPLGDWYVRNHINYDGPIENALIVFYLSLVGAVVSTISTPYNGLMMAKERFFIFCVIDVLVHVIRFVVALVLVYAFNYKLLIYTIFQSITLAMPTLLYYLYCKKAFPNIVKLRFVTEREPYKQIFKFSGWVSYGAVASVVRNQAAALLVNSFFNTIMNTALGIANSLNTYLTMFANNLTQPMQPQITKSYATGDYKRANELLVMSTKFSFLVMLFVASPFFIDAEWLLGLWLGEVPVYAASFTILLIVDNLVTSFNSGLSVLLFADGRIALYQVVVNSLRLSAVIVAYLFLKWGAVPEVLFYTYISFSILIVFSTQWCLHKTLNYNNGYLFKKSYMPSISVLLLFLPMLLLPKSIHPFLRIILSIVYLLVLEFCVGLSHKERGMVIRVVSNKFFRKSIC